MPSILESGKAQVEQVVKDKPQSFTVGGHIDTSGEAVASITYDRTIWNGFGLTAYARAWWHDAPVATNAKPKKQLDAGTGFEISKKY